MRVLGESWRSCASLWELRAHRSSVSPPLRRAEPRATAVRAAPICRPARVCCISVRVHKCACVRACVRACVKQNMGGFFAAADAADGELPVEGGEVMVSAADGELPVEGGEVVVSEYSYHLAISHSLKQLLSSSCTFYEPEVVLQYLSDLRQRYTTGSEQAPTDGGCLCAARRFPARGCANGSLFFIFFFFSFP